MKTKLVSLAAVVVVLQCCFAEASGSRNGSVLLVLKQLEQQDAHSMLAALKYNGITPSALVGDEAPEEVLRTLPQMLIRKLSTERDSAKSEQFEHDAYGNMLIEWTEYLQQTNSYISLLLQDVVKRCSIEFAAARILRNGHVENQGNQSTALSLAPEAVLPLARQVGGHPQSMHQDSLRHASETVWASFGHTNIVDGYVGLVDVLAGAVVYQAMTTSKLSEHPDGVALCLRMLNTEQMRVCGLEVLRRFVRNGGDVDRVERADTTYFYKILPMEECSRLGFEPLAKSRSGPDDLLLILGRTGHENNRPPWIRQALE